MRTTAFTCAGFLVLLRAATAGAAPVEIRVVDPNNRPVTGARLVIGAYAANQTWTRRTDARGRVSMEMTPIKDKRLGDVVAFAPGFGLARIDNLSRSNLIRLQKERVLEGTVRDAGGKPVSGAAVRLRDVAEPLGDRGEDTLVYSIPSELRPTFSTRTGADGRWRIGGIPAQTSVVVALDDPAYRYTTVDAPIGRAHAVPVAQMTAQPGASIAGRVVDEAGRPAKGIKVFTHVLEPEHCLLRKQEAVTGVDGAYIITGLASGNFEVQAEDPSKEHVAAKLKAVAVRDGQTTQAPALLLTEGVMLRGTITDKASGQPLGDVYIESSGPQGTVGTGTRTDARGHYQLRLVAGTTRLYVAAPYGYVRRNVDVSLAAHEAKSLDVALARGLSLSGTTLDEKGQPVGGVFLFLYLRSNQFGPDHNGGPPIGVTSDAKGQWQVKGLAPGHLTIAPEATWQVIEPSRGLELPALELPAKAPMQVKVRKISGR